MPRVRKREAAKLDLVAQWLWYAEHGSVEVADRFLSAVEGTLRLLAAQPESGSPFLARNPGLQGMRSHPVSSGFETILLFYFPLPNGVELVRVVHGNRDLEQLLTEGFFG